MTDWAIGDIQGCADAFFRLLKKTAFNPNHDTLWVAGDMVNRGHDNLSVLRYIKALGQQARIVLGNHDLHLIAASVGARKLTPKDTLHDVITAPDCDELVTWLRQQPLIQCDAQFMMSHAGIPHIWTEAQALSLAQSVSQSLQSDETYRHFLFDMYGNAPDQWHDTLTGTARLRVITNYLTRMRFINANGNLDFTAKEDPNNGPAGYTPWFEQPTQTKRQLIFGHWAGLEGRCPTPHMHALDTGCVWGGQLTMLNLDTLERTCVDASR
ncbi:symmetrical bis(5'-nucleosyl)-tetraphosphatase [Marinagarivorans algicola]|uniref:symmetrical bis(5'-nucleosyl)-tetraphosphatase n=1 Tax=Marinagarivorans algicola TaxID=1513270 RepID=UPI0006B90B38|nr:symmetrical bis(5'-nucleosyl)-tetraphosphatase [Marinagarivorans algicola]